ncbi:MAG: helix-turn-helix domain-containing protein [Microthrixaceae bacterium]|nr:helix-turn-helix domain-containing protein [Microthrixaceae bacterium]
MSTQIAYDTRAAAAAIGVSESHIGRAIRSGQLPAKRSGKTNKDGEKTGKYLIAHDDLVAWFNGLEDAS